MDPSTANKQEAEQARQEKATVGDDHLNRHQRSGPHEVEQARQEMVTELKAEQGADWAEAYRPGSFGCHELLDRASLLADNLEQYVLSHPACVAHAEWYALADQAATVLRELYQRIGAAHVDTGPAAEKPPLPESRRPSFQPAGETHRD